MARSMFHAAGFVSCSRQPAPTQTATGPDAATLIEPAPGGSVSAVCIGERRPPKWGSLMINDDRARQLISAPQSESVSERPGFHWFSDRCWRVFINATKSAFGRRQSRGGSRKWSRPDAHLAERREESGRTMDTKTDNHIIFQQLIFLLQRARHFLFASVATSPLFSGLLGEWPPKAAEFVPCGRLVVVSARSSCGLTICIDKRFGWLRSRHEHGHVTGAGSGEHSSGQLARVLKSSQRSVRGAWISI